MTRLRRIAVFDFRSAAVRRKEEGGDTCVHELFVFKLNVFRVISGKLKFKILIFSPFSMSLNTVPISVVFHFF